MSAVCSRVASRSTGYVPSAVSSETLSPIRIGVGVGLSTAKVMMTYSPSGSLLELGSPTPRTPTSVLTSVTTTPPISVLPSPV